eukprot:11676432-Alexandrium_andersonii.AAC.1
MPPMGLAPRALRHRREDLDHAARVVVLGEGREEGVEGVRVDARGVARAVEEAVGVVMPQLPGPGGGGLEALERRDEELVA